MPALAELPTPEGSLPNRMDGLARSTWEPAPPLTSEAMSNGAPGDGQWPGQTQPPPQPPQRMQQPPMGMQQPPLQQQQAQPQQQMPLHLRVQRLSAARASQQQLAQPQPQQQRQTLQRTSSALRREASTPAERLMALRRTASTMSAVAAIAAPATPLNRSGTFETERPQERSSRESEWASQPQPQPQLASLASQDPNQSVSEDDELFRRLDKNGSGQLSCEETITLIPLLGMSVSEKYIAGVWAMYDRDSSGQLSREEFGRLVHVLRRKHDQHSTPGQVRPPMPPVITPAPPQQQQLQQQQQQLQQEQQLQQQQLQQQQLLQQQSMLSMTVSNPLATTVSNPLAAMIAVEEEPPATPTRRRFMSPRARPGFAADDQTSMLADLSSLSIPQDPRRQHTLGSIQDAFSQQSRADLNAFAAEEQGMMTQQQPQQQQPQQQQQLLELEPEPEPTPVTTPLQLQGFRFPAEAPATTTGPLSPTEASGTNFETAMASVKDAVSLAKAARSLEEKIEGAAALQHALRGFRAF